MVAADERGDVLFEIFIFEFAFLAFNQTSKDDESNFGTEKRLCAEKLPFHRHYYMCNR